MLENIFRYRNSDGSLREVGQVVKEIHDRGYHCSETMVRGLWPYLLPDEEPTDTILRMTGILMGGIADSMGSHCGCVTAPMLMVGAKYGRKDLSEDDRFAAALARGFWQRFIDNFGTTHCTTLRQNPPACDGLKPSCGCLMVSAARLFLEFLQELEADPPSLETMAEWELDRSGEPCHEHVPVVKYTPEPRKGIM